MPHSTIGQGPALGTVEFEFTETVNISQDDPKIIKKYPSAFTKTALDDLLKAKGVNTQYLYGLSGCVLAAYLDDVNLLDTLSNEPLVRIYGIAAAAELNGMEYCLMFKNSPADALVVLKRTPVCSPTDQP
ncbi:MAG TPA: isochorismatase family protein [bacterium]|nr:isochorismatase family protein [bacterium]